MKNFIIAFVFGVCTILVLLPVMPNKTVVDNTSSDSKILRLQEENTELARRLVNEQRTSDALREKYDEVLARIAIVQTANEVGQYLGEYPEFLLLVLDKELEAVEADKAPHGSFSDYFVPIVRTAQLAGVSQVEIDKRLDRVVRLVKQGKPLSTSAISIPQFTEYIEKLKNPVFVR
jgi:hypothetical protein